MRVVRGSGVEVCARPIAPKTRKFLIPQITRKSFFLQFCIFYTISKALFVVIECISRGSDDRKNNNKKIKNVV